MFAIKSMLDTLNNRDMLTNFADLNSVRTYSTRFWKEIIL